MKIGVFGGSFNPPHKMHYNIAMELINQSYLDKIVYVPTGSKYKYKTNLLPDKFRFEMLKLMIKDDRRLEVSDYELKSEVVYTCETLEYFKQKYSNDEIYFICGADNLSYIDEWKNGFDLLKNYKILVILRTGQNIDLLLERFHEYKDNIIVANIPIYDLSSTFIRNKIKNNEDVLEYIFRF